MRGQHGFKDCLIHSAQGETLQGVIFQACLKAQDERCLGATEVLAFGVLRLRVCPNSQLACRVGEHKIDLGVVELTVRSVSLRCTESQGRHDDACKLNPVVHAPNSLLVLANATSKPCGLPRKVKAKWRFLLLVVVVRLRSAHMALDGDSLRVGRFSGFGLVWIECTNALSIASWLAPNNSPAQLRNEDRNPCGTTSMPSGLSRRHPRL